MRQRPAVCLTILVAASFYAVLLSSARGGVRLGQLLPLPNAETITAGAGALWATGPRQLVRIDPRTDTVIARVRLPAIAGSVAVEGRRVWVVTNPIHTSPDTSAPGLLWSIDTATNQILGKPIPLSPMAQGEIVAAAGSLWVTNDQHGGFGRLYRINPNTRKITARIAIPSDPNSLGYAAGSLWLGESDTGKIVRVNPQTGSVEGRPIDVGGALLTVASDGSRLWVANSYSGSLVTLNAHTGSVINKRPLPGVTGIAVVGGRVWAALGRSGELAGISGSTDRQTLAVKIPGGVEGIKTTGNQLWVINSRGLISIST